MGQMQERITTTKKGSITSVQAIYVPADDLTDPSPATTFSHVSFSKIILVISLRHQKNYPVLNLGTFHNSHKRKKQSIEKQV